MAGEQEQQQQVGGAATGGEGAAGGGMQTGQVSDTFDMTSAVDSISESLFSNTVEDETAKPTQAPTAAPTAAPTIAPVTKTPEELAAEAAAKPADGKPVTTTAVAPKTWKPEEAAVWEQIPEAARAAIARREEDMHRGIEGYKAAATFGNTIQEQVLRPYEAIMRAQNVNPVAILSSLMNAQYQLATGSNEQRLSILQSIAKDYGVDLGKAAPAADGNVYQDPEVAALRAEIQQLRSGQTSLQQQRQQETLQQQTATVNAFAADPKNIHFNDCADDIVRIINSDPKISLQDAYEKAIWLNPVTRAKEIARQDAEKQAKAAKDAEDALARAKAGKAANVQVKPKVGAATLPLGSMEDTMQDTLREIKSRST